jgi:ribonuclease VapC
VIVDTSALLAVLFDEPDAATFGALIDDAAACRLSAASFLEAAIVVDRTRSPVPGHRLDDLVRAADMIVEPVTEEQARIAREAYRQYGRGRGHLAGLNFGDCFAYALARVTGEPLLFKGDDFIHTDITPALRS